MHSHLAVCLIVACASLQAAAGFTLYEASALGPELGDSCINSLTANIDCHELVRSWDTPSYRPSLGNVSLTDEVCAGTCGGSLRSWFGAVSSSCAGKALHGSVATRLGGYMWAGYNETCVKDPRTRQYCNDIIANFTLVPSYTQMPQAELCHTCYIRRLAFMQSSQYSIYDEFYKVELEYVYSKCGVSGPTDIPPPLTVGDPPAAPYCVTGKRYTTVAGDTCESISNKTSVSSAALYMGNQDLVPDCSRIGAGLSLCVPITCQTYYVRPADTCATIEVALGLEFGILRYYNSWLDWECENLQPATDFYGKMICVSPQGGTFTGTASPKPPLPTGGSDGYTETRVPPPEGATVAQGTTLNCGRWHVVAPGDSCSSICVQGGLTISLFKTVNPSVNTGSCSLSLQEGTALCTGPTYKWNVTDPATTNSVLGAALPTFVGAASASRSTSATRQTGASGGTSTEFASASGSTATAPNLVTAIVAYVSVK